MKELKVMQVDSQFESVSYPIMSGSIAVQVVAPAGAIVSVERSMDDTRWTKVESVTVAESGWTEFGIKDAKQTQRVRFVADVSFTVNVLG